MKKLITLLALITLTSACSPKKGLYVDPEFKMYFKMFEIETNTTITNLNIVFAGIENPTLAGHCTIKKNSFGKEKTPSIEINATIWKQLSVVQREALIYHEIAHCVQGRDHQDDKTRIMNTKLPFSFQLEQQYTTLMSEFLGYWTNITYQQKLDMYATWDAETEKFVNE